jgi:hypothetical protein
MGKFLVIEKPAEEVREVGQFKLLTRGGQVPFKALDEMVAAIDQQSL